MSSKYPHGFRTALDKSPESNIPRPGEDTSTWECPPHRPRRIRVAAPDPRICRCCKRRTPDADIEEFRRESNIVGYQGIPEICQDCCGVCSFDDCLTELAAATNCFWRSCTGIYVDLELSCRQCSTSKGCGHVGCPFIAF